MGLTARSMVDGPTARLYGGDIAFATGVETPRWGVCSEPRASAQHRGRLAQDL
jgi:hypothetical protein